MAGHKSRQCPGSNQTNYNESLGKPITECTDGIGREFNDRVCEEASVLSALVRVCLLQHDVCAGTGFGHAPTSDAGLSASVHQSFLFSRGFHVSRLCMQNFNRRRNLELLRHWQYACPMIQNKESRSRLKCADCGKVLDLSTIQKHRKYGCVNLKNKEECPPLLSSPVPRSPPAASTTRLPAHAPQESLTESGLSRIRPIFNIPDSYPSNSYIPNLIPSERLVRHFLFN